jgi:hypothetical protein
MCAIVVSFFILSSALFAATKASCTFDTFTVPSKYTLSALQGVSDDGTVVGQLVDNTSQLSVGFMRSSSGTITVYSMPKSLTTSLYSDNATGTSAGSYEDATSKMHGLTLSNGKMSSFNYPKAANTWLFGLNHVGTMVGSYGGGASVKGFMVVNGKYSDIVYPGTQATYPMAVNDKNAVVGSFPSGWVSNGFLWENGKFTTINFPKSRFGTILLGINNSGVIVGNRISADKAYGFIYENGAFKPLVYPGADYIVVGGINNNGLISGQIFLTATNTLGYTAVCK